MGQNQIDLLKLGQKFYPTPKSNQGEIEMDLKEIERKFRLTNSMAKQKRTNLD